MILIVSIAGAAALIVVAYQRLRTRSPETASALLRRRSPNCSFRTRSAPQATVSPPALAALVASSSTTPLGEPLKRRPRQGRHPRTRSRHPRPVRPPPTPRLHPPQHSLPRREGRPDQEGRQVPPVLGRPEGCRVDSRGEQGARTRRPYLAHAGLRQEPRDGMLVTRLSRDARMDNPTMVVIPTGTTSTTSYSPRSSPRHARFPSCPYVPPTART